jgi:hypothetical protein
MEWMALLLALLGLGGNPAEPASPARPSPAQPAPYAAAEEMRVAGDPALLLKPYKPRNRVVLFAHGTAERAEAIATEGRKNATVRALLDAGYWIAAGSGGGDAWGNTVSVKSYVALGRALRKRGLKRIYVLAESQGGLPSTLMLPLLRPAAWAGIYPVCDLVSVYRYSHSPTLRRSIRLAYGARTLSEVVRLARGRSPAVPRNVARLPMIFWASPGDTTVPKRLNADRCAEAARARGAQVTVVSTHGDHGDGSNFDPARLVRFFDAAPGR